MQATLTTKRRVRKFYLQHVSLLNECIQLDLPQKAIAARLNAAGLTTFRRTPFRQDTVSRLIKHLREAGELPPDPHA
jgi:hypothetical protein